MENFEVSLGTDLLFSGTKAIGGGGGEPDICRGLRILSADGKDKLCWKDSGDTVIENQVVVTWGGTKLVRKEGSYPETPTDGEELEDNKVLNAHITAPFEAENPEGKDYKYRLFPYSASGTISLNKQNCFNNAIIYEFIIDNNETSPAHKIKYCGINEHFTPAHMDYERDVFDYGSWKDTWVMKAFRPCLLKHDGTIQCYLNPHNLALDIDGNPSNHTSLDGDYEVMVEIDPIWIYEEVLPSGNYHICLANTQVNDQYDCFTHWDKNNKFAPHYYVSKYLGQVQNTKMRSISGQQPTSDLSSVTQRQYSKAHGDGWDLWEYSFIRLMRYLLLLVGRSTDGQTTFGNGVLSHSGAAIPNILNGTNDTKGDFYGKNDNATPVTVFFIDNFWGFAAKVINGCSVNNQEWKVKMTPNKKDGSSGTDYNLQGTNTYFSPKIPPSRPDYKVEAETKLKIPTTVPSYIKNMLLVPKFGLFPHPDQNDGSATTGFCDYIWGNTQTGVHVMRHGGGANNQLECGPFTMATGSGASATSWDFASGLSFKLNKENS